MAHQIDCFKIHLKFFKYCGIWASEDDKFQYYNVYSKMFVFLFVVLYDFIFTMNFIFMEKQMDHVIEESIVYFTLLSIISQTFTFLLLPDKIAKILSVLESNIFQPCTKEEKKIIMKAKKMNVFCWKMFAFFSFTSNLSLTLVPLVLHLTLGHALFLPVCSYDFFTEEWKEKLIYPLYFYQIIGSLFNMWYSVNTESFFLGIMNLAIAQVDILDHKLRRVTDVGQEESIERKEEIVFSNLKQCLLHYSEIAKYCSLVQETFSATLLTQFNVASWVICVCLFRLTRPLTPEYLVFLTMYVLIMVLQILIPCWFGHKITDKSGQLIRAAYDCDWPTRPRRFKTTLYIFMTMASRPLSITGGKIFPLILTTFTSIANSAYSFYTLLRNVQNDD